MNFISCRNISYGGDAPPPPIEKKLEIIEISNMVLVYKLHDGA